MNENGYYFTWATPCDGNIECIYGSDEEGCETPISMLALILFGVGFLLVITKFLYAFKSIHEIARNITYSEEINDDTSNIKQLHIGILTQKKDSIRMEQLFINELNIQGNEGEAICSFKVFCPKAF